MPRIASAANIYVPNLPLHLRLMVERSQLNILQTWTEILRVLYMFWNETIQIVVFSMLVKPDANLKHVLMNIDVASMASTKNLILLQLLFIDISNVLVTRWTMSLFNQWKKLFMTQILHIGLNISKDMKLNCGGLKHCKLRIHWD